MKSIKVKALAKIVLSALMTLSLSFSVLSQEADSNDDVSLTENGETLHSVKITAKDGFMLAGNYYAGKSNLSGVLLLHDCNSDSRSFKKIISLLSEYGLHALSLDFRGYGGSVSEQFSHAAIKRRSKDINTYQSEVSALTAFWPEDILAAYQYLRERVDKKRDIAVLSVGCSSAQAIALASKMRIKSFVMVTPELDYMQKEAFKNLIDMPVYFLDSIYHADTYQTTKELFEWNGDRRSIFQIFKGIKHGHTLLNGKRYIAHDIALWLDETLPKN